MQHQSAEIDICPSFNSYALSNSAQTAVRVAEELSDSSKTLAGEEDDFEFDVVIRDTDDDHRRAGPQAINQDKVRSIFSVSERNSPSKDVENIEKDEEPGSQTESVNSIRNSLSDLFFEDRDPPSCSSSDAEDTYCIWSTKPAESSPARCKKSNSTGSSLAKRLKFLSFIRRSNSEGKNSFAFLNPSTSSSGCVDKTEEAESARQRRIADSKVKGKRASSAHEIFYVKNRAQKEGGRRRSYLPYRQDLVGIFSGYGKDRRSL